MKSNEFRQWKPMPAPEVSQREVCVRCKKPRVIGYDRQYRTPPEVIAGKKFPPKQWYYKGYGHFCSLRCAAMWANSTIDSLMDKNIVHKGNLP